MTPYFLDVFTLLAEHEAADNQVWNRWPHLWWWVEVELRKTHPQSGHADPRMVRTYKFGVVTMVTQSLSHTESGGTEAQSLRDIVSLQEEGIRLAEKWLQPQVAWQPLVYEVLSSLLQARFLQWTPSPLSSLKWLSALAHKQALRSMTNPEPFLPQHPLSLHFGQSLQESYWMKIDQMTGWISNEL